jgi:hypothetical protein
MAPTKQIAKSFQRQALSQINKKKIRTALTPNSTVRPAIGVKLILYNTLQHTYSSYFKAHSLVLSSQFCTRSTTQTTLNSQVLQHQSLWIFLIDV